MMIKPILLCYIEEKNPRNALVDAIHLDSSTPIFITKTLIPPRRLRRGGMSNLGSGFDARYPDRFLFLVF